MIQIQATFAGYNGMPCTLFSLYDHATHILGVSAERDYRTERYENCIVLTNVPDIPRDKLFTDDDLQAAIAAFYALQHGLAADGRSPRLDFGARAARANPGQSIQRDGIDVNGPRYRVSAEITCAQMAALATCLYAIKSDTVARTVEMAESLRLLLAGDILTI